MATCCREVRGFGGPGMGVLSGEMVPLGVSVEGRYKRKQSCIASSLYTAGANSYSHIGKMVV